MFVIPSIILGFALSVPCIWAIWSILFSDDVGFKPSIFPGISASIQALLIGILIPTLSAIIPIKRAIDKSLLDSLTTQRAKLSGMVLSITDNGNKNVGPYLVSGSIAVLFGVSIYYVMPLALITQQLGLILIIFIVILLGMIFGLSLFASNLQGFLEVVYVYLFFFWEKKSMRKLVRKNLIAHRQHNFLTSIIYSLVLGCIIFLLVTANLLLQSIQEKGVDENAAFDGADI